jgi:hypothetical protein
LVDWKRPALILEQCYIMAGRVTASAASPVAIWILVVLATLWFLRAARTVLIPIAPAAVLVTDPAMPGEDGYTPAAARSRAHWARSGTGRRLR